MNEVDWSYGTHGRQERCIQGLVGMPEGKRSLGIPGRKVKDNIKKDLNVYPTKTPDPFRAPSY